MAGMTRWRADTVVSAFLMREVQLAEHFSEEFVQDILGVFAAEVALDNERERKEGDSCGASVNDERYKACIAHKITRDVVKPDGGCNHDAEGDECAEYVQ